MQVQLNLKKKKAVVNYQAATAGSLCKALNPPLLSCINEIHVTCSV